jgi:hypothetical protein
MQLGDDWPGKATGEALRSFSLGSGGNRGAGGTPSPDYRFPFFLVLGTDPTANSFENHSGRGFISSRNRLPVGQVPTSSKAVALFRSILGDESSVLNRRRRRVVSHSPQDRVSRARYWGFSFWSIDSPASHSLSALPCSRHGCTNSISVESFASALSTECHCCSSED